MPLRIFLNSELYLKFSTIKNVFNNFNIYIKLFKLIIQAVRVNYSSNITQPIKRKLNIVLNILKLILSDMFRSHVNHNPLLNCLR